MIKIYHNYSISKKSYIHVGGRVKTYCECDDLYESIKYLKNKDFISIGNTSKILFNFSYCSKLFFCFTNKKIVFFKDVFFAYSGISLYELYFRLKNKNITGFSLLATIPGFLGGSIVNNSSFKEQCISDLLIKILVFQDNKLIFLSKEELNLSYRNSSLKKDNLLIIGGYFKIIKGSKENIKKEFLLANKYRLEKQKFTFNSLGSTFKNTEKYQIGKILDNLSLKGYIFSKSVKVSPLHANFILIKPYSSSKDVNNLIKFLEKVLYNYLGEKISKEIQIINKDGRE